MHATDAPLRLAVLASGRGSNLQAILDAIAAGQLAAEVAGVFSDREQAPALQKVDASRRWSASPRAFADRAAFDSALGDAIAAVQPDWVICAGYMRILGEPLVRRFTGRMLNIHPSLLPKYRGLHTHARALEAGDAEHGASVHLVVPELDAGPVIAQAHVPVLPDDTAESLAARVLDREHPLLLATLQLLASGRVTTPDGRVHIDGQCLFTPLRLESAGIALV
ncbi:phosphoribosylglycinamide formyltransferase [Xanthomonas campestris pv. raphani]|uniref:phosphoribosylglycinamide formyltransferase n=1 Tax=Xanthomonas campestris TaxID=339 RepID=UPI002368B137|nr:phosphoribosylglycinamide formyltransferase [Xanthomonas campestris]MEA9653516.1 phosphoribosylglycinamide formyltransferase [Xanthomonas campestris pv. raphani]MEA9753877.1 phosphoribosylglycinamide formyltransferase [Xanthomonas campestris pv. raphani]MEA9763327.1 phosphoribosylglycinamide formyltransferase [Xanthomonas campestris pv. raphani]MEA9815315.1 phosphoribosylglycinamide formyltransferase [Xanthomonas campestris pv. raphani]MEA9825659.1 phosphoribosylglycinamide formyltransferas